MASESEPFIAFKEREENDSVETLLDEKPKHSKSRWRQVIVHMVLVVLSSAITASVLMLNGKSCETLYTDRPLKNLDLHYSTKQFTHLADSPFAGNPGPNVDAAWKNLLGSMYIRVTAAELARHNQTSIALTDGGGYLAWLEVFHELHCINMLRKWIYRDHYHPNLTSEEFEHRAFHVDHCLDMLRQASMCHVDTSLTTFLWTETDSKPMFNAQMAPKTCVDFDRLVASTQDRWVAVQEIKELENPLMNQKEHPS